MENIPVTISTPRWCHALTVQHLGLVEGEDVDVVTLVLLDDVGRVLVGVEGVHEHEGDVDVVRAVEELDLTDGQVEGGGRRRMERGERRRRRRRRRRVSSERSKSAEGSRQPARAWAGRCAPSRSRYPWPCRSGSGGREGGGGGQAREGSRAPRPGRYPGRRGRGRGFFVSF
jgi:hypothetical protein